MFCRKSVEEREIIMESEKIFTGLARQFEGTFIEELIPGMLHNFANPLNGIMGRSKLLQKRAQDALPMLIDRNEDRDLIEEIYGKILRDIDLISQESDRFYNLFNDVAAKIHRLHNKNSQSINISELIESEIAFFDFYLDFKHKVEKDLALNRDIPLLEGTPSDYSMAMSTIIRHAMKSMDTCDVRRLSISTECDLDYIYVTFQDTGEHADASVIADFCRSLDFDSLGGPHLNGSLNLISAMALLKKYDARFNAEVDEGCFRFSVIIPYKR